MVLSEGKASHVLRNSTVSCYRLVICGRSWHHSLQVWLFTIVRVHSLSRVGVSRVDWSILIGFQVFCDLVYRLLVSIKIILRFGIYLARFCFGWQISYRVVEGLLLGSSPILQVDYVTAFFLTSAVGLGLLGDWALSERFVWPIIEILQSFSLELRTTKWEHIIKLLCSCPIWRALGACSYLF